MMKIFTWALTVLLVGGCKSHKAELSGQHKEIERMIRILSDDDMQGRAAFTTGIDRAANFIEKEFEENGLQPFAGNTGFRQRFPVKKITVFNQTVSINGVAISPKSAFIVTTLSELNFTGTEGIKILSIKPGQNFLKRYNDIVLLKSNSIIEVDETFTQEFRLAHSRISMGRVVTPELEHSGAAIFILGVKKVTEFGIHYKSHIAELPLFNVVGVLSGKSKASELVIFSAHLDHLGVLKPDPLRYDKLKSWIIQKIERDSIANGADDNASGVTAVITLARLFKEQGKNERTLVFVAFTAEEIGGLGSEHFLKTINPKNVVAMFNIEMIGKASKFGLNTAYVTGYERSDFGMILQRNISGSNFKFYPDPYPDMNLFYRSDNSKLAAVGIPAHTISTEQIDSDRYYHSVNDEVNTLDIPNISATINAIALSSRTIISGSDTPKRIAPVRN